MAVLLRKIARALLNTKQFATWVVVITLFANSYTLGSQGVSSFQKPLSELQDMGFFNSRLTYNEFFEKNKAKFSSAESSILKSVIGSENLNDKLMQVSVKKLGSGSSEGLQFVFSEGRTSLVMNVKLTASGQPYLMIGKTRIDAADFESPSLWMNKVAQGYKEQTGETIDPEVIREISGEALVEQAAPAPVSPQFRFMSTKELELLSFEERRKYMIKAMKIVASIEQIGQNDLQIGQSSSQSSEEKYAHFYHLFFPQAIAQARSSKGQRCLAGGWEGQVGLANDGRLSCIPTVVGNNMKQPVCPAGPSQFECNPAVYGRFNGGSTEVVGVNGGLCVSAGNSTSQRGRGVSERCGAEFEKAVSQSKEKFQEVFKELSGTDNCLWNGSSGSRAQCDKSTLVSKINSSVAACENSINIKDAKVAGDQRETCKAVKEYRTYIQRICTNTYKAADSETSTQQRMFARSGGAVAESTFCKTQAGDLPPIQVQPPISVELPKDCSIGENAAASKCICGEGNQIVNGICIEKCEGDEKLDSAGKCSQAVQCLAGQTPMRAGNVQECRCDALSAKYARSEPSSTFTVVAGKACPEDIPEPVVLPQPPPLPTPCPAGQVPQMGADGKPVLEAGKFRCVCSTATDSNGRAVTRLPVNNSCSPVIVIPEPAPELCPNGQPKTVGVDCASQPQPRACPAHLNLIIAPTEAQAKNSCANGSVVQARECDNGWRCFPSGSAGGGGSVGKVKKKSGIWGKIFKGIFVVGAGLGLGFLIGLAFRGSGTIKPKVQAPTPPIPLPNDTALPAAADTAPPPQQ